MGRDKARGKPDTSTYCLLGKTQKCISRAETLRIYTACFEALLAFMQHRWVTSEWAEFAAQAHVSNWLPNIST